MHMEFVTVGKASSDKIHVKYNDKIVVTIDNTTKTW